MTYTNVFGNDTIPPSDAAFTALSISTDTTVVWPYNTSGGTALAKIINLTATGAGLSITLPDAREVSPGEDFLIRNVGANSVTIKDAGGSTVATVSAGAASYFYVSDNTTAAGVYGVVLYGVGASNLDAGQLIGYGIIAIGTSLNQSHPVTSAVTGFTVDATYRASLINYTGGAGTLALTAAAALGDNFFTLVRNSGTGTLSVDPSGAETIDGQSQLTLQPGDSCLIFCSGTSWFSVGLGRAVQYNFTQLVKDVTAGGTITLTSTEAANKLLTFTGAPSADLTVVVPSVVAVYYILSSISTAYDITVKTAAGTGVVVSQSARVIAICDSTNVYSAQSIAATTSLSLVDGTVASPALNFSSQTDTGLYKQGAQGIGIAVAGSAAMTLEPSLAQIYLAQGYTHYTTGGAPSYAEGRTFYDPVEHTLAYFNDASGVTVNVGQELLVRARNNTGSQINNGQVVYVSGASSGLPTIALARADSALTSDGVIGIATHDIANNSNGYVTISGLVHDLDTSAFVDGAALYLSATTAGALTPTRPASPNHGVLVGYCTLSNAVTGVVMVRVGRDAQLSQLQDVVITSVQDDDLLQYDTATQTWKNVSVAGFLTPPDIGTTVQGYDADTAKTDVAQAFTAPQRSALLTDNDGNFDLSAKQNFKCTPTAGITLTFSSQADGLSGSVVFVNGANYAIAAHANTKLTASDLAKLSVTGTYRIDYLSDGTNAYCSVVGAYA